MTLDRTNPAPGTWTFKVKTHPARLESEHPVVETWVRAKRAGRSVQTGPKHRFIKRDRELHLAEIYDRSDDDLVDPVTEELHWLADHLVRDDHGDVVYDLDGDLVIELVLEGGSE